jgi:hypothetical protein
MRSADMLRAFLALLPESLGDCSMGVAIGGAILGAIFWLTGARFSRSLVTLIGVAVGTSVGMRLPGWLGLSIDGMAIGVGGAVILGVSGYLLHRTWIGVYLGALLSLWAGIGSWIAFSRSTSGIPLSVDWKTGIFPAVESMWNQLPLPVAHNLAIAASAGLLAGVLMTIFWPRLCRVTAWSLAGVTLIVVMAGIAQQTTHSEWAAAIRINDVLQASALFSLVALGGLIQWGLTRRADRTPQPSAPLPMDD